ncbi:MAG: hypothetical protein ABIH38_01360 [Patescibacteria group bacterium]
MRFNPFRKRRTVKGFAAPKRVFKNPFFSRENFSDVLFRTLKIHYGLIILLTFGLLYLIFFSEIFQIRFIVVKGAVKVPAETIESYVREELSGQRLGFLPQSNYFFLDEKSVREKVREKIQATIGLEEYSLDKRFPRTVSVRLKETIPSLTWKTGSDYYYLDKSGIVAQSVAEEEVDKNFPLIEDLNNLLTAPQEQTVSPQWLASIPEITKDLGDNNLAFDHFLVPVVRCYSPELPVSTDEEITLNANGNLNENTNAEIDDNENLNLNLNDNINASAPECRLKDELKKLTRIDVLMKDGYQIYLATDRNIAVQINNLNLVLTTKLKGKTSTLKYIDLRFDNRIYYQ